ncbi:MAG: hypothetical protein V4461_04970 [Pseudomonadota bacterium]
MDHQGGTATTQLTAERRSLGEQPFVSLAEALTWIAFRDAMLTDHLRRQVEGHRPPITESPEERLRKSFAEQDEDVPEVPGLGYFHDRQMGLDRLTDAWRQLRDDVARGDVNLRGRFTAKYSLADARLAEVEDLKGSVLATFSQFDISTGGIRRQPEGSPDIMWQNDPQSFSREFASFGDDPRATDGYLLIEVERVGLLGAYRDGDRGIVPKNRSLNHDEIIGQAKSMLVAQPSISIGSAAASIVADLSPHPKTGKPRDARYIERMIAHLWKRGLPQSPR